MSDPGFPWPIREFGYRTKTTVPATETCPSCNCFHPAGKFYACNVHKTICCHVAREDAFGSNFWWVRGDMKNRPDNMAYYRRRAGVRRFHDIFMEE